MFAAFVLAMEIHASVAMECHIRIYGGTPAESVVVKAHLVEGAWTTKPITSVLTAHTRTHHAYVQVAQTRRRVIFIRKQPIPVQIVVFFLEGWMIVLF